MSVAERVTVRRVAGAGRGVCVDRSTAGEGRGRRAGSCGETTVPGMVILALLVLLGVGVWSVATRWAANHWWRGGTPAATGTVKRNGESEFVHRRIHVEHPPKSTMSNTVVVAVPVPKGWQRRGDDVVALTNTYVQIGSNGLEQLDPRWHGVLADVPWMEDGDVRTVTSGTNIFMLHTRRLNGTNLTVVTRVSQDPTNEVVMWIEQDSVGGAKVTWPEEPTRLPWWATALLVVGSFACGYGWGRWAEAGWWHRKRGEIE